MKNIEEIILKYFKQIVKMENEFNPNKTQNDIIQEDSFGGTYFRSICSSITKKRYKNE